MLGSCESVPEALELKECVQLLVASINEGERWDECACEMKEAVRKELLRTKREYTKVDVKLDKLILKSRHLRAEIKAKYFSAKEKLELDEVQREEAIKFNELSQIRWKQHSLEDLFDYYKKICA